MVSVIQGFERLRREKQMRDEIDDIVEEERERPTPGSLWRHFRGGLYRVICVAVRESDYREQVVYESESMPGRVFTRDLCQWGTRITLKEGGDSVPRFAPVEPAPVEVVEFVDSKPCGRPVAERGPEY